MSEHDSVLPDGDSPVTIPKHLLAVLFDAIAYAVPLMGQTSGGFSNEDVDAFREVAGLLGADPEVVTPEEFRCSYHPHEWEVEGRNIDGSWTLTGREYCRGCGERRGRFKRGVKAAIDRQEREIAAKYATLRRDLGITGGPGYSTSFIERGASV